MIDMKKSKRILYWGNIKLITLIQNWGGGRYQNNNAIGFKLMSGMDYTVSGFF